LGIKNFSLTFFSLGLIFFSGLLRVYREFPIKCALLSGSVLRGPVVEVPVSIWGGVERVLLHGRIWIDPWNIGYFMYTRVQIT